MSSFSSTSTIVVFSSKPISDVALSCAETAEIDKTIKKRNTITNLFNYAE
ncbi:hypothetical protein [Methanobrevibacter sp. V14]|nr:hypothetical protein [Methanobrevibacter sp. V14]